MYGIVWNLALLVALVGGLVLSVEIGFQLGRRDGKHDDPVGASQVGAIQAALLGLLGLLVAFSFSAAAARFLDRQDLIAADANSIGTMFLRAELLNDPMRYELQSALSDYRDNRLRAAHDLQEGRVAEYIAETEALHARIWDAAFRGVRERPEYGVVVLGPANELIDLHTTRYAASRKKLPLPVLAVLLACSAIGCGIIGYSGGLVGRRRWFLTSSLAVLLGATIYVTLELDQARTGMLQLSDAPIAELKLDVRPQ